MGMKLFQYCVIYNPIQTKEQKDAGEQAKSELVIPVTDLLANNEKEAGMLAARAIPEKYMDRLDRLEIGLRPF